MLNLEVLGGLLRDSAPEVQLVHLAALVPERRLVVHHELLGAAPRHARRAVGRGDQPPPVPRLAALAIQRAQLPELRQTRGCRVAQTVTVLVSLLK